MGSVYNRKTDSPSPLPSLLQMCGDKLPYIKKTVKNLYWMMDKDMVWQEPYWKETLNMTVVCSQFTAPVCHMIGTSGVIS